MEKIHAKKLQLNWYKSKTIRRLNAWRIKRKRMEKNIIIIIISRIIGCEHLEFRISHWDREFVQRLLIKCKESKSQPGQAAAAECCELHWLFDVFCQNFSTFDLYDSVERTPSEMYFYRQLSSPCGKCCAFIVILSVYLFVYILTP